MVSAHYPPNFVSGGTLQPARLAGSLKGRGNEVRVYAGLLDDDAKALETSESVEAGVPVHWIATSHFVSWNDDRNWDNPEVTADFARVLRDFDPDVVHVHSLQTLGVGVVREAVRHRARVVVTMHDFWWICARTFLVDRSWRPCSLVVECGDCPCELGRPWLERRTSALRGVLAGVDEVLAPSEAAAAVLRANGIGGVRVDENGMDGLEPVSIGGGGRPPDRSSVTVVYTGGNDPMKGAGVVPRVAAALGADSGVRLVAYGMDPSRFDQDLMTAASSCLETRPAFSPERMGQVFAEADVLLVPSLMRETYSIVTREALGAGVPVICSDSLGPEEIVRDGHNGLIVAASDSETLAEGLVGALEHIVSDGELLEHLRSGAREHVEVRSLEQQVTGLEALYAHDQRSGGSINSRVRSVCFVVGIEGAPLRYRALMPAEALELVGVDSTLRWYRDPDLVPTALAADAVVFYRVPATVEILELIDRLREHGVAVLYDLDDLIFDPELAEEIPALDLLSPDEAALWLDGVRRYRTVLEASDVFVTSTQPLADHAGALVPGLHTERFDNGVGTLGGRAAELALRRARTPGPLRLGYFSGTTTHDDDWRWVAPAVAEVMATHPEVELWLGGHLPEVAELGPFADRMTRLEVMPWTELLGVLRDIDVNLAPLEPGSRFNEAKSAIKWLEAGLVGTATVASPTPPFVEAVSHGRNGMLAETTQEWVSALNRLVDEPGLRATLGRRARRDALLGWAPRIQGERYRALLERAAGEHSGAGVARSSSWTPVAPSEPTEPHPHRFERERLHIPWRVRVEWRTSVARARIDRAARQGRGLRARAVQLRQQEGLTGPLRGALRVARRFGPG